MAMDGSRRARSAHAALALGAIFILFTFEATGQTLTADELERLRAASGGTISRAEAERISDALGRETIDALERGNDPRAAVEGLEAAHPDVTPPPAEPEPVAADGGLTPFGYDIFLNVPEGLSADLGPVGPRYVVGTGDELVLTLWGDTELVQSAAVDREGRIFFRDIGLLSVAGQRLEHVTREVRVRLERVYSGIGGDDPTTFFDVTVGRLSTAQVFVFGEVTRPGAYRVPSNGTVLDLLYRAGGAGTNGSLRGIRVMRGGTQVAEFDLYRALVDGDLTSDVRLETGDVVLIPPVGPRVHLAGEVLRPAIYELKLGEKLSDLFRIAGGLTPLAYVERAVVERIDPTRPMSDGREYDWTVLTLTRAHLTGETPFALEDGDRVEVLRITENKGGFVELGGTGLWKPGRVAWHEGLTIGEAIRNAGGLTRDASLDEVQVVRVLAGEQEEMHSLRLDHTLNGHSDASFVLEDGDRVLLRAHADFTDPDSVSVIGQVRAPGVYPHRDGLTLQDVLFQAGGLKDEAFNLFAEVARVDPSLEERRLSADVFRIPLDGWERGGGDAARFALEPYDQIHVWTAPGWQKQRNVQIRGQVKFPGTYALTRHGERLTDLIARAGGLTPRAYPPATVFTRARADAGRIAVKLSRAIEEPGGRYDLALEPGDVIEIPEEPHTVKIVGAVGFPASVVHERGKRVGHYIAQAGGFSENADEGRVLVTLASGEVKRGTGGFLRRAPEVDAGSVIFVPKRAPEKEGTALRDVSSIVSILTGAATTIYLISQVSG